MNSLLYVCVDVADRGRITPRSKSIWRPRVRLALRPKCSKATIRLLAIIEFAGQKRITQIFIGHSSHENWRDQFFGDPVLRLIRAAEGIDVRVFPD